MLQALEVPAGGALLTQNPYLPHEARIVRVDRMVKDNYLFTVRILDDGYAHTFNHRPGQFLMLSIPGCGEAPISISSSPTRRGVLELCVRRAGRLTAALYRLGSNDVVGVRGPYGNGFPVERIEGGNLLLVAGGLGMAPLRSLLWYALDHRDRYQDITVMYGAKTPGEMLFREEFTSLVGRNDLNCLLTVDRDPTGAWTNHVGLLPSLFDLTQVDPATTCRAHWY